MNNAGINRPLMKAIMGHENNEDDMTDYYTTHFENEDDKLKAVNSVLYLS